MHLVAHCRSLSTGPAAKAEVKVNITFRYGEVVLKADVKVHKANIQQ